MYFNDLLKNIALGRKRVASRKKLPPQIEKVSFSIMLHLLRKKKKNVS